MIIIDVLFFVTLCFLFPLFVFFLFFLTFNEKYFVLAVKKSSVFYGKKDNCFCSNALENGKIQGVR